MKKLVLSLVLLLSVANLKAQSISLHTFSTGNLNHTGYPLLAEIIKPADFQRVSKFLSGERGIRTPGTSRYGSFQDYCNRPLYHLSSAIEVSDKKV